EPVIRECPLAKRFAKPVHEINPVAVRENIEHRIRSFGMCTPDRTVELSGEFVGFGASEILSAGLTGGLIDCAVIAGDGAGTLLATTPTMVQGIGGRMSGLVRTTPHPAVIARIESGGGIVLDRQSARIDQAEGVARAYAEGFQRVAVTVASADDSERIRREYPETLIVVVHTTGTTAEDAGRFARSADLITACASRHIREIAGKCALIQAGSAIPVFAMTARGKEVLLWKVLHTSTPMVLMGAVLPYSSDRCPDPLV
ncbi:MAG: DUF2099 family protein, partial [Methanolinea sp.]|nr:DUF2099 family protein [Methanolinea sp.]